MSEELEKEIQEFENFLKLEKEIKAKKKTFCLKMKKELAVLSERKNTTFRDLSEKTIKRRSDYVSNSLLKDSVKLETLIEWYHAFFKKT